MKQHPAFPNLLVSDHPLVLHKLSLMRETSCSGLMFKMLLKEIGALMGYELTRALPLASRDIETPVARMKAPVLGGHEPVIVSILRAGLGMAQGLETLLPGAPAGHIGLYRDEKTHEPVQYLVRLPVLAERQVFMVDPMLATGHSARHALEILVKNGARADKIRFMALVAAPEGVRVLLDSFPDVKIFTAALDERLNENAYIVPGLGDAGDRLFGTGN